jgi:hypothetical protein
MRHERSLPEPTNSGRRSMASDSTSQDEHVSLESLYILQEG